MIAKKVTYIDFEGTERTENFFFHLSETELVKLENSIDGGLTKRVQTISDAKNVPELMKVFEELINISYGEKSPDGRRFVKSKELTDAFMQTEAYNIIYMELYSDADVALKFINGIMPAKYVEEAARLKTANSADANIPMLMPMA